MIPIGQPAYSLRVQLFSPTAYALDDKPKRNFRVVTSPRITVSQFCEEASRIHELNYGNPLGIRKVQDDQAFDINQNETLGSIFPSSSIIRVIQSSTQPGIRDSIPPTSGLRFEPSRKRGRREDIDKTQWPTSAALNKRQKILRLDPARPLPSRESEFSLQNNGLESLESILIRSGSTELQNSRISQLQIPETPEQTRVVYPRNPENSLIDIHRSVSLTQDDQENDQDETPQNYSMRTKVVNSSQEINSNYSQHRVVKENSSLSSKSSLDVSEEEYHQNRSTTQIRLERLSSLSPASCSPSIDGRSFTQNIINNDKENSLSEKANTDIYRKVLTKPDLDLNNTESHPHLGEKLCALLNTGDPSSIAPAQSLSTPTSQKSSANQTSSNKKASSHLHTDFTESGYRENSAKGRSASVERITTQVEICGKKGHEESKSKEMRSDKKNTKPTVPDTILPKKNLDFNQTSGLENYSIDNAAQMRLRSKIGDEQGHASPKGSKVVDNKRSKNLKANNDRSGQNPVSAERLEETSSHKSENSLTPSHNLDGYPSPILSGPSNSLESNLPSVPLSNQRRKPGRISLQNRTSSPSQPLSSERTPTQENPKSSIPSNSNGKLSSTGEEKEITIKPPNRPASNSNSKIQVRVATQAAINTSKPNVQLSTVDANSSIRSFTPILPPKKLSSLPKVPLKRRSIDPNSTPATISNTNSSVKTLPPSKVTPIVPPKKMYFNGNNPSSVDLLSKNSTVVDDEYLKLSSGGQESTSKNKSVIPAKVIEKNKPENVDSHATTSKLISESAVNSRHSLQSSKINTQSQLTGIELLGTEKPQDPELEGEEYETFSQNSSGRDSRSPIAFHRTPHLSKTQRFPTLSSDSHSETVESEDLERKDNSILKPGSVSNRLDNEINQRPFNSVKSSGRVNRSSTNQVHSTFGKTNINRETEFDKENDKENDNKNLANSHVMNSSPPVQRTLPSHGSISVGNKILSNNQDIDDYLTPLADGFVNQPSSEIKKPRFAFGASLTAMHQNGKIVGRPQGKAKPNGPPVAEIWKKTESESEGEDSDSESQSTSEDEPLPVTLSQVTKSIRPDSDSNSDDSDMDEGKVNKRAIEQAREELFAKIKDLKNSQVSIGKGSEKNLSKAKHAVEGTPKAPKRGPVLKGKASTTKKRAAS